MKTLNIYIKRLTQTQCEKQIDLSVDALYFFGITPKTNTNVTLKMKYSGCNDISDIYIQCATNFRFANNILRLNPEVIAVGGDFLCITKDEEDVYVVKIVKEIDNPLEIINDITLGNKESISNIIIDNDTDSATEGSCDNDNLTQVDSKYRQYITAIKSKPFLLLAGISGTGKSRIVRELARSCWPKNSIEAKSQKPSNFEIIQVKPNWHDSSELIGYVSRITGRPEYVVGDFMIFIAKAWANWLSENKKPYFLCLDEMNLAPVEQYFAEYLSALESRKIDENGNVVYDPIVKSGAEGFDNLAHKLAWEKQDLYDMFDYKGVSLPPNLIVVGTVNMDETTFSFSRKVLDRAMTIEMNEVDLHGGLDSRYEVIREQSVHTLIGTAVEGVDVYKDNKVVCDMCIAFLEKVNIILEPTPFKVAYRTRNEFLLYVVNNLPYTKREDGTEYTQEFVIARALDEITSMKILSRIEGDESKVTETFLNNLHNAIRDGLHEISSLNWAEKDEPEKEDGTPATKKSVSLVKIAEMKDRLKSGYTSFWS